MSELVDQGKIRSIGISNYTAERIEEWLDITDREGFHAPVVVEPQYNLVERGIEADILPLARTHGLAVVPYYSLAHGFLTGKYDDGEEIESPRAPDAAKYLTAHGRKVLDAVKKRRRGALRPARFHRPGLAGSAERSRGPHRQRPHTPTSSHPSSNPCRSS